jgi:hypothetical protein
LPSAPSPRLTTLVHSIGDQSPFLVRPNDEPPGTGQRNKGVVGHQALFCWARRSATLTLLSAVCPLKSRATSKTQPTGRRLAASQPAHSQRAAYCSAMWRRWPPSAARHPANLTSPVSASRVRSIVLLLKCLAAALGELVGLDPTGMISIAFTVFAQRRHQR